MWHGQLEKDLKSIFGIPKIQYASVAFGKEQDVLYCNIDNAKNRITRGQEQARIDGRIAVLGLMGKNLSGFLSKKIQIAPTSLTDKFVFSREETNMASGAFEDRFNIYSVSFTYFYRANYNPNSKKITTENFFINIIKTIFNQ